MSTMIRNWLAPSLTWITLTLVVVLAACSNAPPPPAATTRSASTAPAGPTSGPSATPVVTTAPTRTASTPAAAATPSAAVQTAKPEGVLRVALGFFGTDQLDPMLSDGVARNTIAPMFDMLISANPDGTMAPGIAERWELAPDGLSWTFFLRKGLQWHNGWGEVTADDIKFSMERVTSAESKTPLSGSLRQTVKSIDVVDKYAVRVNTNGTATDLPFSLSVLSSHDGMVVPKRYIEEKGVAEFRRNPVGSGPWKFVRHVPGSLLEFEAISDSSFYKNSYRSMPAFQQLSLTLVPEEATRVALLKTGQVDVIEASPETKTELEKAGLRAVAVPMTSQFSLVIWTTWRTPDLPTANLKVRQALNLAMNREEVVRGLLDGGGSARMLPTRVFPFSIDIDRNYWQSYGDATFKFDPQRAKQLLAEAGYSNGFDLKMWSYQQAGTPWLPKLAEVLGGYFRQIGVRTELMPVDYAAFQPLNRAKPQSNKLDGTVSLLRSPARPVVTPSLLFSFGSKGESRLLNDPDLDKAMDAALSEPRQAKREELLKLAIQISADSMTSIPVVYPAAAVGLGKSIGKWTPIAGGISPDGMSYELATHAAR